MKAPAPIREEWGTLSRWRKAKGTHRVRHRLRRPVLVGGLGHAAQLCRLPCNAAIEARVPFAHAFAHRLSVRLGGWDGPYPGACDVAQVPARTNCRRSEPELTRPCERFPVLRSFPRSMLNNAVAEGCRARVQCLRDRATTREAGRPLPKLRFRGGDDWSVTTDDFWLLRIGTDHAHRPAKADHAGTVTMERNQARRARKTAVRETAWADERERATVLRLAKRGANRSLTRVRQNAALFMRDVPVLVATDPTRMVPPLLRLDGPAERRARREAGLPVPALRGTRREERRARAMRRNTYAPPV